jgi:transposase
MEIRYDRPGRLSRRLHWPTASHGGQTNQGCSLFPAAAGARYDAGSRSDAARNGGVGLQTIRDWVRRSNTWGPDGLKDCKASGQPSRLKDEHRRALIQMVEEGPNPAMHGVVRWRLTNVAQCA